MIGNSQNDFLHKFSQTNTQIANTCNSLANNSSADMKLS